MSPVFFNFFLFFLEKIKKNSLDLTQCEVLSEAEEGQIQDMALFEQCLKLRQSKILLKSKWEIIYKEMLFFISKKNANNGGDIVNKTPSNYPIFGK